MITRCCKSLVFAILCLTLTVTALPLVAPAGAQEASLSPPSPQELRQQLLPLYLQTKQDVQYHSFWSQLEGNLENRELVDRYLRYLPISPKELLEIEMEQRRFEVMMPRTIYEWHLRWIELHPETARRHYGVDYVEGVLRGPRGTEGLEAERQVSEAQAEVDFRASLAHRVAVVGTNRNVASTFAIPPTDFQGEIQVVVNPNDLSEVVAAANTWDNIPGTCSGDTQAVFYSSDGGTTWGYTCSPDASAYPSLTCSGLVFGSDPALYWADNGDVFINHMLLCVTAQTRFAIVVARSVDAGVTWSGQGVVINSWGNTNLEDKNFYAIDNNAGSPFQGRHYTCWDRNNNEKSAYSTDNGQTWTEVDLPPTPSTGSGGAFDLACELAVEDNGTVHVIYDTLRCLANCNNEQMFYSRSTNGGVSWSAPILIADFNLVGFSNANCPPAQDNRCINPFGSIAVDNSGGLCDGTLYVTYSDWTSGGAINNDIWVIRSTDGGTTWSAPVLVNDDGLSGTTQFHPFLVVDQSQGYPVVGWHDTRNDPTARQVDYFLARSMNCGVSFQANIQVSQPSTEFNNSTISFSNENTPANPPGNPNQYGEYLGLDAQCGKAYMAWTDTRHFFPGSPGAPQKENLGFVVVDLDRCDVGSASGRWNRPVGATLGAAKGTLYNTLGVPQYTIKVELNETSPGQGKVIGKLYGVGTKPDYYVEGEWKLTSPPNDGKWEAKIIDPNTNTSVGVISGTFSDDPLAAITGSFRARWEICP